MPIKIFFCYAHEDEKLLDQLKGHLKPWQKQKLIDIWYDRDIDVGKEWEKEIKDHLNAAQIILLLISPDFMRSDYCYSVELKQAIERHKQGKTCIVPIILRPVHWQQEPLDMFQALPTDAKPVRTWSDLDEAFFDVASGIRKVIKEQWFKESNTYYEDNSYIEALQAIIYSIKLDAYDKKHDIKFYKMKGKILQKLGRIEDSLAAYEEAIGIDPSDISTYCSKGMLLSERGEYDAALSICARAIELDSGCALAFHTKGKILQKLGRYQDALEAYEQAIHIDPDNENNAETRECKGQVLELLERYAEAVLTYEHATKIASSARPRLYYALGLLLQKLNRNEDALAAFEQAILLDSDNIHFLKEKALTLQRLERANEAWKIYKKARQLGKTSSLVEVVVQRINVKKEKNLGTVILKAKNNNCYLFIKTTDIEILSITHQDQAREYDQLPRGYQLMQNIVLDLGASIAKIIISGLTEEIFYGTVILTIVDKQKEFDIHVVEAIALAMYTQTPIFVEEDIWKIASTNSLLHEENTGEAELASLIGSSGSDAGQSAQSSALTNAYFELLYEASRELGNVVDDSQLDQAYATIVRITHQQSQSSVIIRRYDEDSQELVVVSTSPCRHSPPPRMKIHENFHAHNGRTVVIHDINQIPSQYRWAKSTDSTLSSLVFISIAFRDRYYGIIEFFPKNPVYSYNPDITLIEALAQQLAYTIYRIEVTKERREFEQRVTAAEEMSTISHSTFELVHRLGNSLGLVGYYINAIQEELQVRDVISEYISEKLGLIDLLVGSVLQLGNQLKQEVERTSAITHDELVLFPPSALLEDALSGISVPANIQKRCKIEPDVAEILVYPKLVVNSLHQLIINAIQAMPEGGELTCSIYNRGSSVVFEVEDTGVGIPPEQQAKIFDLFYSTKNSYGFGLWIARCDALKNDGKLKLQRSIPGGGTTFVLIFPKGGSSMNNAAILHQRNSLLIIDHQADWRTVAANSLQVAGYHVQTLEAYEDVLPALEKGQTFNLVILGCVNVAVSERLLITHLLERQLHLIVFADTLTSALIRDLFVQEVVDVLEKTSTSAHLLFYIDRAIERIARREQQQLLEKRREAEKHET